MVAERGGERGSSGAEDGGRGGWTVVRQLARKWKLALENKDKESTSQSNSQIIQNHQNPGQHQRIYCF